MLVAILMILQGSLFSIPAGGLMDTSESEESTRGSWLDITIDSVSSVMKTASNEIYPGQTITIKVGLMHDNRPIESDIPVTSRSHAFDLILVVDDGYDYVTTKYQTVNNLPTTNGSWNGNFGQPNPRNFFFDWEVPQEPPEEVDSWRDVQYRLTASVTVDDDDTSDNYLGGPAIRVSEPNFEPWIFEPGQKEDVNYGPTHDVSVGEYVNIPFELHNKGPNVDIVGIEFLSVPEGWGPEGFQERPVYPSNFEELLLTVYISPDPMKSLNKRYEIVARAYSAYYPEGPYNIVSEHTFRFQVHFKPGCKVVPREQTKNIVPGVETRVEYDLINTGNGLDSFRLQYDLSDKAVNDGWEIIDAPLLKNDIGAGSTILLSFRILIPTTSARYSNANLVVMSTSQTAPSYQSDEKISKMTIFADTFYDAKIEEFEEPFLVQPGKENHIKFNFTNMGNDRDKNQHLSVAYKPYGWSIYIDQSKLKAFNGIGPRTTVLLEMIVIVPESAETTEQSINLPRVTIEARGSPSDVSLDQSTFRFSIPMKHKVDITSPQYVKKGFIGGQVEYILDVKNRGNWFDSFNLTVESDWVELERTSIYDLRPNGTWSLAMWVDIPNDASADEPHKIRVWAYSLNETKEGETLIFQDFFVEVAPFYQLDVSVAKEEKSLLFSADHSYRGDPRQVKIAVHNMGNARDEVALEFEDLPDSYDWIEFADRKVEDIPADSIRYGQIRIAPEADQVQPGWRNVTLVARSLEGEDVVETLEIGIYFYQLKFTVVDYRLNNESIPEDIGALNKDLDRKYSLQVKIENSGTVDLDPNEFGTMFVVLYDGVFEVMRQNVTYLPIGESTWVYFSWTASQPGPHTLTVSLEGDEETKVSGHGDVEEPREVKVTRDVPSEPIKEEIEIWKFMPQVFLLMILGFLIFLTIYGLSRIEISEVDTGYTEDGTYKPWAIKEKLKQESEESEDLPSGEKKSLPQDQKQALPAGGQQQPQGAQPVKAGPMPTAYGQPGGPRPAGQPMRPGQPQPVRPGQGPQARPVQPRRPGQ